MTPHEATLLGRAIKKGAVLPGTHFTCMSASEHRARLAAISRPGEGRGRAAARSVAMATAGEPVPGSRSLSLGGDLTLPGGDDLPRCGHRG